MGPSTTPRWRHPIKRRASWLAIAFTISLGVAFTGGGVVLWAVYRDSRPPTALTLGVTLLVFGAAAAIVSGGVWIANGGRQASNDGR